MNIVDVDIEVDEVRRARETIASAERANKGWNSYLQKEEEKKRHEKRVKEEIEKIVDMWKLDEGPYQDPSFCMREIEILVSGPDRPIV